MRRLLSRLYAIDLSGSSDAVLWKRAAELVQGESPGDLNQALMEMGALVCTPRGPDCVDCPVRGWCNALATGTPERFPVRKEPAPSKRLLVSFAWIASPRGVWLAQRSLEGLWAGLWELPSASGPNARQLLETRLGMRLVGPKARFRHQLTHRDVRVSVWVPATSKRAARLRLKRTATCKPVIHPLEAPLSAVARKAIVAMLRDDG